MRNERSAMMQEGEDTKRGESDESEDKKDEGNVDEC